MSTTRDFSNNFTATLGVTPRQGTDNTAIVATATRDGCDVLAFLLAIGTIADAACTFTALMEESVNNSDWTTVAAADMSGTLTGLTQASDDLVRPYSYFGNKKYVRLTVTPANNTGLIDWTILIIKGLGRVQP